MTGRVQLCCESKLPLVMYSSILWIVLALQVVAILGRISKGMVVCLEEDDEKAIQAHGSSQRRVKYLYLLGLPMH